MNVEEEYFRQKTREMVDEIHDMAHRYDSKILGIILLTQGAQLLQACHTVGITSIEETKRAVEEALKGIYTPLPVDQRPRTEVIGKPMRLS